MKQRTYRLSTLIPAVLLLAAHSATAERTFKWVDAQGNTHYGDRVPMQATAQHREEINEQGRTLKAYAEPGSQDAIAEQKRLAALEYEKRQQTGEQARRDKELLEKYPTESDILIARDTELEAVEEFIRMTNIRIGSLQKRLEEFTAEASDYTNRGKPVPEFVQHQTSRIQEQIEQNEAIISSKQAEMDDISKRYAADITRYQSL
ncbi:MAG TPA: DUF4124 domain-containing protein [Gammaproteobacteria bacterium]|nr:DUF4124 domain-containing protein [Gammaproteobacteria bacterium]